ncbi:hypothetical protein [Thermus sp. NEB1569]|uniref:hypothetical protein n=1 Tax=Thermus sp. NEB1569 TaxID=2918899 RepID=UPI001EFB20F5|nr:hypothetical protein [Thermus sp. NEB1569]ULR41386.1 hypothetical protein MI302_03725 [Thermus sp. NEB1569]
MAGRDAGAAVQVRALRAYVRERRGRPGPDPALLLWGALNARMRRVGPPGRGRRGEVERLVGQAGSYALRVGGRWYPWDVVRAALRRALELDRPPHERSREARDLAAFLWSPRPDRVGYVLARPRLLQIWREIHG